MKTSAPSQVPPGTVASAAGVLPTAEALDTCLLPQMLRWVPVYLLLCTGKRIRRVNFRDEAAALIQGLWGLASCQQRGGLCPRF